MEVIVLLWRNMKWRYSNVFTIFVTILQPMLWLILYSSVASETMQDLGIQNYTTFILPGLFLLVCFGACSSSGIMNYLLKRDGSFYRILIAPVKRSTIVLAQMIESCICSFIEITIMFIVSLFFQVKIECGILEVVSILLILFLTAFIMSGITYAISLILPNEVIFETVMNAIVLPLFFLSSALFPVENITGGLKIAIILNPFTHVIEVIRKLILTGNVMQKEIVGLFVLLLVLSFLSFWWANQNLKKETKL